jgi:hypothetical protein
MVLPEIKPRMIVAELIAHFGASVLPLPGAFLPVLNSVGATATQALAGPRSQTLPGSRPRSRSGALPRSRQLTGPRSLPGVRRLPCRRSLAGLLILQERRRCTTARGNGRLPCRRASSGSGARGTRQVQEIL